MHGGASICVHPSRMTCPSCWSLLLSGLVIKRKTKQCEEPFIQSGVEGLTLPLLDSHPQNDLVHKPFFYTILIVFSAIIHIHFCRNVPTPCSAFNRFFKLLKNNNTYCSFDVVFLGRTLLFCPHFVQYRPFFKQKLCCHGQVQARDREWVEKEVKAQEKLEKICKKPKEVMLTTTSKDYKKVLIFLESSKFSVKDTVNLYINKKTTTQNYFWKYNDYLFHKTAAKPKIQ